MIGDLPARMLSELAAGAGELSGDALVCGMCDDSRSIRSGEAFLCMPRAVKDAAVYAKAAAEHGASCMIVVGVHEIDSSLPQLLFPDMESLGALLRRWFATQKTKVRLFGITGTDGKTSVAWMLREACQRHFGRSWAVGTLGWVREDGSFADIGNTTPSLLTLHGLLAAATRQGVAAMCCEVSSHGIAQGRIAGLPFSGAAWTTLGHDHLQDHGGFEAYAAIKQSFIASVIESGACAVGNADQPGVLERLPRGATRFGHGLFRDDVELAWEQELPGMLRLKRKHAELVIDEIPLGEFHAVNIACVALILMQAGVGFSELPELLTGISAPPGRMQAMNIGRWQVYVDYAHTPEALQACLQSARRLAEKHLIVVFGCGGERDREKRPQMGRIAVQLADVVWLTSDNPRGELPELIASEVESGMPHPYPAEVHLELNRESAIQSAVAAMQPGDVLVIAGKGHEDYMEIGGRRLAWSDAGIASDALHEKSGMTEFRACA
ncbi:MAG: UDP-N-acetylmuramoylalanyl-D-glutamate--2,6-diaminopimelate ligase [Zetaproteobacteria bacterium CG2_30_59_37]|nr:MAG: UDP-N-acetylmuramoylalanyl-D-glutamate--2,6-diaminopimelate ligase [Zetaproteobacteria bacterium CG2_30_59_37]